MPAFVSALNSVDLPTFGRPTMPHLRLMSDFPALRAAAYATPSSRAPSRPPRYHAMRPARARPLRRSPCPHRLADADVAAPRHVGGEFGFVRKRCAELGRERVSKPEAGVVARAGVAAARIAETRDQTYRSWHRACSRKNRSPPTSAADGLFGRHSRQPRAVAGGCRTLLLLLFLAGFLLGAALFLGLRFDGLRRGRRRDFA